MYFPNKENEAPQLSLINDFGGLNKQFSISENEFSDMENMSSRRFPLVCPREKRSIMKTFVKRKIKYTNNNVISTLKNAAGDVITSSHIKTKLPKNPSENFICALINEDGSLKKDAYEIAEQYIYKYTKQDQWVKVASSDYFVTYNRYVTYNNQNYMFDVVPTQENTIAKPDASGYDDNSFLILVNDDLTKASLFKTESGAWQSLLSNVDVTTEVVVTITNSFTVLTSSIANYSKSDISSKVVPSTNTKEYYVYTDSNDYPISVYYIKSVSVGAWERIPSTQVYTTPTYRQDTKYISLNIPTAFTCDGAWIISTVRSNGSRRLYVANNELEDVYTGVTVGDVNNDSDFSWDEVTDSNNTLLVDEINAYLDDILKDAETKRQIVCMGGKICLFPEKYYINMFDHKDKGYMYNYRYPLWQSGYSSGKKLTISPCTAEGKVYENALVQSEVPDTSTIENGQVWVDTSGENSVYKIWDKYNKEWGQVATTYVQIYCKGAFKGFKQWDAINIKGLDWNTIIKCGDKKIGNYASELNALNNQYENKMINFITDVTKNVVASQLGNIKSTEDAMNLINENIKTQIGDNIAKQIESLNYDSAVIIKHDNDSIVITGLLDKVVEMKPFILNTSLKINGSKTKLVSEIQGQYSFKREVPDLDYYLESNNRIWGCKYGLNDKGEMVNEIYSCKQGDPTNWNFFYGISTDSYTVSLGTSGAFTGCINFNGIPTFFKNKCIHKVYGSYPAAYQLSTATLRGVGKGFDSSLVVCNNYLYYATANEFVVYDGSAVYNISSPLGKLDFKDVVTGTDQRKVYFQCTNKDDTHVLYVYDTENQLWHKEDDIDIMFFANDGHVLYYIERYIEDNVTRYRIKSINEDYNTIYRNQNSTGGEYPAKEDSVKWSFTTGNIGFGDPYSKYIQKISVRADVPEDAFYNVSISYDGKDFEPITATNNSEGIRARDFYFRIKRCDYFKLKFTGVGDVTFISLYKTYVQGSDKK